MTETLELVDTSLVSEVVYSSDMVKLAKPKPEEKPTIGFWGWAQRFTSPLALIFSLFAFFVPRYNAHAETDLKTTIDGMIDSKLDEPRQTLTNLRIWVGNLSTKIDGFDKRLDDLVVLLKPAALQKIKDAGAAPIKAADLPSVKTAIDVALATKLPAASYVAPLEGQLRNVSTEAPQYWQTIASLVTLKLADGSAVSRILPPCELVHIQVIPGQTEVTQPSTGAKTTISGPISHTGCTVAIDDVKIVGHTFKDCFVIFRGGVIDIDNVSFENCIWDVRLPPDKTPTVNSRKLLSTLLELTGKKLVLSIPG